MSISSKWDEPVATAQPSPEVATTSQDFEPRQTSDTYGNSSKSDFQKALEFYDAFQKDRIGNLPRIIKSYCPKDMPNPVLSFEPAFRDYPEILNIIYDQNFSIPSPIQSQAWPVLMSGKDLLCIAPTGTGKTLAFLLPALIHINKQPTPLEERGGPIVLIMVPSRELTQQIEKEISKYKYKYIKSACFFGGDHCEEEIDALSKKLDIVIATPNRLKDLVKADQVKAINFSFIIIDEADRMMEKFESQIRLSLFDVRPDRQLVMTASTWSSHVQHLAENFLKFPVTVNVGSLELAAVHTITQKILFLEDKNKEASLVEFISNMTSNDKIIVFCGNTARTIDILCNLIIRGINCVSLYEGIPRRDGEQNLEDMRNGVENILITTNMSSRGIDIGNVTHVINYDFPRKMLDYVHRIGRTGRAGRSGIAISYITQSDFAQALGLIKIMQEANQNVPRELEEMAERYKMSVAMTLEQTRDKRLRRSCGAKKYGDGHFVCD